MTTSSPLTLGVAVLGYAGVVEIVTLTDATPELTGPVPTADRRWMPVITIGTVNCPLPTTS